MDCGRYNFTEPKDLDIGSDIGGNAVDGAWMINCIYWLSDVIFHPSPNFKVKLSSHMDA